MAQLKVYQIDHYRQKIRDLINPLRRIIDLKLSEKKDIVKQQISKKLRQSLKIEKWKKDIDSYETKVLKLEQDFRTMKRKLEEQQLSESNKFAKILKRHGAKSYNLPSDDRVITQSQIEDCFSSIVDDITEDKCKTMQEFKEINKLDHVQSCMNDVLYEEGSSEGMNSRLDDIMKGSFGIPFRREQALQLTKQ
jgi:phenylalanyl-tRNA synthetase alpha subunit